MTMKFFPYPEERFWTHRRPLCGLRLVILVLLVAAILLLAFNAAFAQTFSDTIQAKPWVEFIAPYVNIIVPPIVTALVGFAVWKFQQWTGMQVQATAIAQLKSAAATQAGKIVAAAEDNLAGRSITVNHPAVVTAANEIMAALPATVALTGATPDKLRTFVAGEVGKLQAQQTSPVNAPLK